MARLIVPLIFLGKEGTSSSTTCLKYSIEYSLFPSIFMTYCFLILYITAFCNAR